jgi:hypothetical protein
MAPDISQIDSHDSADAPTHGRAGGYEIPDITFRDPKVSLFLYQFAILLSGSCHAHLSLSREFGSLAPEPLSSLSNFSKIPC